MIYDSPVLATGIGGVVSVTREQRLNVTRDHGTTARALPDHFAPQWRTSALSSVHPGILLYFHSIEQFLHVTARISSKEARRAEIDIDKYSRRAMVRTQH